MTGQSTEAAAPSAGTGQARLPLCLGWLYVALLAFPALVNLPGGAPLPLTVMLVGLPVWYEAARSRHSPFDPLATRSIMIVLGSAGFLIVWSLLSTFGTPAPLRAGRYLSTLVAGFAIYLLVRSTVTRHHIDQYVEIAAAGLALAAMVSLLAYDLSPLHRVIFKGTDRAAGLFKNPNQFGMAISTTIPVTMALVLSGRRRLLSLSFLILMLLGLFASGSKTNLLLAWTDIVAMLLAQAIIVHRGLKRIGMMALYLACSIAAIGLGILALTLLNPRALTLLTRFLDSQGELESLMTRSFLWDYSLRQFLGNPFLGQGAGQRIDIFYREADVSHSHNVFLDYMRTLGAPGLMVVAVLIATVVIACLWTMHGALRARTRSPATRLTCFGLSLSTLIYVAANMSSDSFGPSTSPYFWLFAFLALAARRLLETRSLRYPGRSR